MQRRGQEEPGDGKPSRRDPWEPGGRRRLGPLHQRHPGRSRSLIRSMPRQPSPDTDAQLVDAGRSTTESGRGAHVSGGLSHRRPKIIVDQGPPGPIRAAQYRSGRPNLWSRRSSAAISERSVTVRPSFAINTASGLLQGLSALNGRDAGYCRAITGGQPRSAWTPKTRRVLPARPGSRSRLPSRVSTERSPNRNPSRTATKDVNQRQSMTVCICYPTGHDR
jgi:hypothetical protein